MNKHEYICAIVEVVRAKSSCFKRKVGAVFVNADYEILATGFNEAPKGFPHCDSEFKMRIHDSEIWESNCGDPCTRTIHAEQNAIVQAAKRGTAIEGSILYCTYLPCITCARLLVNLRVTKVVYKIENEDGGKLILQQAAIWLKKFALTK